MPTQCLFENELQRQLTVEKRLFPFLLSTGTF